MLGCEANTSKPPDNHQLAIQPSGKPGPRMEKEEGRRSRRRHRTAMQVAPTPPSNPLCRCSHRGPASLDPIGDVPDLDIVGPDLAVPSSPSPPSQLLLQQGIPPLTSERRPDPAGNTPDMDLAWLDPVVTLAAFTTTTGPGGGRHHQRQRKGEPDVGRRRRLGGDASRVAYELEKRGRAKEREG